MSVVIEVENLYKQYRLGTVSTGTFSHDINRWWHRVRGKQDPYEMVTSINAREEKGISEYVWALEDINFKVNQGEVLGIIGRNGAGKSTLLKLLSKVTAPTKGNIRVKGRIASLLEVGTGFHPELTGRENIFLNGAILGMSKTEIKSKFDEIVDFSGVEKYIDTPVKRYSSGMYVRLAFGVAAHLEPEILIVDEVLAVGDAEFQKKCLGKMKDVSGQGRTVLFVSHNMVAMKTLCKSSIWLKNGKIQDIGNTNDIVDKYLFAQITKDAYEVDCTNDSKFSNEFVKFTKVSIEKGESQKLNILTPFKIKIQFENFMDDASLHISMLLYNRNDVCIFNTVTTPQVFSKKSIIAECSIPENFLNDDYYRIRILIIKDKTTGIIDIEDVFTFQVDDIERNSNWYGKWHGVVRPKLNWEIN
jgi:lipopolysaccharide transport system ATP-binding protein